MKKKKNQPKYPGKRAAVDGNTAVILCEREAGGQLIGVTGVGPLLAGFLATALQVGGFGRPRALPMPLDDAIPFPPQSVVCF